MKPSVLDIFYLVTPASDPEVILALTFPCDSLLFSAILSLPPCKHLPSHTKQRFALLSTGPSATPPTGTCLPQTLRWRAAFQAQKVTLRTPHSFPLSEELFGLFLSWSTPGFLETFVHLSLWGSFPFANVVQKFWMEGRRESDLPIILLR